MSLTFDPQTGLIIVPTRLWGPTGDVVVRLALDTGATGSLISWARLLLVGYDPASAPGRVQITTGSGVEFVPRLEVQKIEALGQERQNLLIYCHTLPPSATVDGVLGLDFFRGQCLTLDFRTGLASLE